MTPTSASTTAVDMPLGLRSVLATSLPTTLGTPEAPERYAVDAVFDRRPSTEEIALMSGSVMHDALSAAGYPAIELSVADRRLRISNTHLAELRDGLATVIADQIAAMSAVAIAVRADAADALLRSSREQEVRAIAIVAMAASVSFATTAP